MKPDVLWALLRHLLTFVGSFLVSKGVLDAAQVETAVGAVLALAAVGWSVYDKRKKTPPTDPPLPLNGPL